MGDTSCPTHDYEIIYMDASEYMDVEEEEEGALT